MIHVVGSVSWLWTNPDAYNWASSEWGGQVFKLIDLAVFFLVVQKLIRPWRAHLECHVDGCSKLGHAVPGTAYRACRTHHPGAVAHRPGEPVTAKHIAEAHARGRVAEKRA
ncbi:MAG TPA: hypothetical protein VGF95_14435 [Solirubrobacteraceae bacterium]|jgi:hypothetical protein